LLAPLLIVDVPPVLDYPNHLARLVLLAAGPDDPVLGRIASPAWSIIPNLAIDVIGPPLLHLLPVHVAGRCLLGAILLLNLAGVIALHRALFARRAFWPLASGLVAYNAGFLLGFLNWEIGSGVAMLFAAAWLTWRETRPIATVAAASAASVILFFCHLMGLICFVLLISSAEIHAMRTRRAVLVRATFPLGSLGGGVPRSLSVTLLDSQGSSMTARQIWDAPADPAVPGRSFYLLLDSGGSASRLAQGQRVAVTAPTGTATSGILIPASALVLSASQSWAYVETKPGTFLRVPVDISKPLPGGYFQPANGPIKAGQAIVTSGAGLLLARETNPSTEPEE